MASGKETQLRVVSLVPSASETLLAWGLEPVAVTRFCELGDRYPTVGGTKDPDIAAIVALEPDVVVMCDQENRLPDAQALMAAGVTVHSVSITSIDHVGEQMRLLASAVGLDPALGAQCDPEVVALSATELLAYVPIWKRPWMTINHDTYGATLLRRLGVRLVSDGELDRYPTLDLDQARARGCQVVLAPTEPYPFAERHRAVLETVAPTRFIDGQDLFWWGSRTPSAVVRLREQLADVRR